MTKDQPYPHVKLAERYVSDVLANRTSVCRWVRLACERHRKDWKAWKNDKDYPYRFDSEKADKVCRFMERFPHTKGSWSAKKESFVLQPWQAFWICSVFGWLRKKDDKRRFRKCLILVPRKNGKALALDTPVPTPEGWSTMGALKVGDKVFGADGGIRKVIAATKPLHGRPCFALRLWDGAEVVADAEHQWITDAKTDRDRMKGARGRNYGPRPSAKTTLEISQTIQASDKLNHRIPLCSPIDLPEVALPVDPYMLGTWLGDGHSYGARLSIPDWDVHAMTGIFAEIGQPLTHQWGSNYRLANAGDRRFDCPTSRLRKMGLLKNKHIPKVYMRASKEQRLALLQGLMDTDGSVTEAGQCEFSNTSERLVNGLEELAWSLGLKPTRTLVTRITGPFWRIRFWAFADFPVFRMARKVARQKACPDIPSRAKSRHIARCKAVPSVPVRCIQVDHPDGMFLVGRSYIPTHNSDLSARIGLYMLAGDGETGAEIYSGATSQKQAWEVFLPALLMTKAMPQFQASAGVTTFKQSIAIPGTASRFEPLIGKPGDGASPSCAIVDEYHEHDDDSLAQTMLTGMGAREQPLILFVSTAGENTAGPCYSLMIEAQRVLEGLVQDDELFALNFGLDVDDNWMDPGMLRKANPNYGVSVSEDFLLARHADAMQSARQQGIYQIKHLNRWVGAKSPFFDVPKWLACKRDIKLEQFHGQRALLGVDLAFKTDFTALALLFKDGDRYTVFGRFYLPEATVERGDNQHYQAWLREGRLIATEGEIVDLDQVKDDILDLAKRFDIAEVAYDPYHATHLVNMLMKSGVACVEVGATVRNYSGPMKELDGLIRTGRIGHDGCPVMTWMMGNVTAKRDLKDNVYPNKARPENKIDGVVALLTALARASVEEEVVISVYEQMARAGVQAPAEAVDAPRSRYDRLAAMEDLYADEDF